MATQQRYRSVDGVLEVNFGPSPDAQGGERTFPCDVCGLPFPESKVRIFRGKVYGVPCGDHMDIRGILRIERARAYRPPKRKAEREARVIME